MRYNTTQDIILKNDLEWLENHKNAIFLNQILCIDTNII